MLGRVFQRKLLQFLALIILTCVLPNGSVRADDTKSTKTSAVGKISQDVDYFSTTLRIGETIETIGKSNLWKAIWSEPAIKEMWAKGMKSYQDGEGEFAPLKKFLSEPANKDLPDLLFDAISHEIFVTSGDGTVSFFELFQELGAARWAGNFEKIFNPQMQPDADAQIQFFLKSLAEHTDKIKIPELMIGFKVSDSEKASKQLKRLAPLVSAAIQDTPLSGRSKTVKIGGDEFLVLALDGSLVPWDMIPFDKYEEKKDEFVPLVKKLKSLKLNISIGLRQGYLLIAISESSDSIAKFGGEGPKLADRPEFQPLQKLTGKPLLGVSYVSGNLRQALATKSEDFTAFSDLTKEALENLDLSEELSKQIQKDVDAVVASLVKNLSKPGAVSSFSFRTQKGWETFSYDFSETPKSSESQLTLLDHLGGDPLLAAVWRSTTTVEDFKTVIKWLTIFGGHAEKAAREKFPDAEGIIDIVRKEIFPILKELSSVTEKKWLPALADGQEGFVLDAKWSSKQWHAAMPASEKAMPFFEMGIVLGVSDAKLLAESLESYRLVMNKALAKVQEYVPGGLFPKLEIPKPKINEKGGNTLAHYPIPAELGLDAQFVPTGGLSKDVAALSLSLKHTERLLAKTPLKEKWGPFQSAKGPIESAFILNWTGLVQTVAPWVDFGLSLAPKAAEMDSPLTGQIAKKAIAYLQVFQGYASTTYREGGVTVTHSEGRFADLKK